MAETRAIHLVNEVMPTGRMVAYGLQHVLAMYAGVIAVPLILATAIGLPQEQLVHVVNASFLMCGVATLLQTVGLWKFGAGLSIAGLVITVIGVALMPVAIRWSAGGDPEAGSFGSVGNMLLAFGVLVLILTITRLSSGFAGRIAILLGLVIGSAFAAAIGTAAFARVGDAAWVGITTPFNFGLPDFAIVPIVSMALLMLTVMVETPADVLAIGESPQRPIRSEYVARGLRADGLPTALAGVFNAFPFTAFAQNVGLVRFSDVKSRFAAVATAGIQILSRVDFTETRNPIIVAVSIAFGVIPAAVPEFYDEFPDAVRIIFESGITAVSVAAILRNIVFNAIGGAPTAETTACMPMAEEV